MPPKETNSDNPFSAGDTKLIICLIKHLKGDLPSDFEAVAKEMGYKDASIAKTRQAIPRHFSNTPLNAPIYRWGQIKRNKIMGAGSPKSGEKATPGKRKSVGTDDGVDDEETPVKKARGARKKKVEAADDGEVPAETVKEEDAMAEFD